MNSSTDADVIRAADRNRREGLDESPAHPELTEYPELEIIVWLAVAAVVDAHSWDTDPDEDKIRALEQAAIDAMVVVYAPLAATARRQAAAAEEIRKTQATWVAGAAEALASRNAAAAAALQVSGDAMAQRALADATASADRLAAALPPGRETEAVDEAVRTAVQVADAARATAQRRAVAADLLARSVSVAVLEVAQAAEAAALARELETLNAALAVEAIAIDSCYRVALQAATTAAHALDATRRPVAGSSAGLPSRGHTSVTES